MLWVTVGWVGIRGRARFLLKWLKDLMALQDDVGNTWFRFRNWVVRKIGNGMETIFWKDKWVGNSTH